MSLGRTCAFKHFARCKTGQRNYKEHWWLDNSKGGKYSSCQISHNDYMNRCNRPIKVQSIFRLVYEDCANWVSASSIYRALIFSTFDYTSLSRYKAGGRQVEITQQKGKRCWENERKRGWVLTAIMVSPQHKNVIEHNLWDTLERYQKVGTSKAKLYSR